MTALQQWQRLSPLAVVFLIATQVQKTVRENLVLFVSLGAGAAFTDFIRLPWLLWLAGIGLMLSVLTAVLLFKRFRFRIDEEAVLLRRGLFEQKELRVRFARIQNVALSQPFYFRPFGLMRLTLQTPGTQEDEVSLPGIPTAVAEALRDAIQSGVVQPTEAEKSALYRARWQDLFAHGMASNQVWLLAGGLAYVGSQAMRRLERSLDEALATLALLPLLEALPVLAALAVLAVLLALFVLSGVIAVIRYWGFSLVRGDDRVMATAGALDRREQSAKLDKITGLSWRQSAVGRLLRRWSLVVRQTRSQDLDMERTRGEFLIPGLRSKQFDLAAALLPDTAQWPAWQGISWRYALVTVLRMGLLAAALAALAVVAFKQAPGAVVVGLSFAVLILCALVWLRYRHWGYAQCGQWMWVRDGMLGQHVSVFAPRDVQQVQIKQSFYQRRHDLATVVWVLPHGTVTVPFLPIELVATLANEGVAAAESALSHRV